jgi:WD40 repeat protein
MGTIDVVTEVPASKTFAGPGIAFAPDGSSLATSGYHTVEIRQRSTLRLLRTLRGGFNIPHRLAYSPDGKLLAVGSDGGSVALFDLEDGAERFIRSDIRGPITPENTGQTGHYRGVDSLVFCQRGRRLISMGGDSQIKIWDTTTGELVNYMQNGQLTDRGGALAVIAAGKRMVTASKTGVVRLWDLKTGQVLNTVVLQRGPSTQQYYHWLWELAISPDARTLAATPLVDDGSASSQNYRVILWDISKLHVMPSEKRLASATSSERLHPLP